MAGESGKSDGMVGGAVESVRCCVRSGGCPRLRAGFIRHGVPGVSSLGHLSVRPIPSHLGCSKHIWSMALCTGRAEHDGWSDRSVDENARLELNSLVEVRMPPTAVLGKKIQVNANHSDVYEAALWVRARVRLPAGQQSAVLDVDGDAASALGPQTVPFADCEFELLYPPNVSFQTFPDVSTGTSAVDSAATRPPSTDEEEVPPPRQLSFSEQRSAAVHRPFSVNWHLNGPRRSRQSTSRNIRLPKFADPLDQAYIKGMRVQCKAT